MVGGCRVTTCGDVCNGLVWGEWLREGELTVTQRGLNCWVVCSSLHSTWPQQCWIDHIWSVGGGDEIHPSAPLHTIHLGQQLVDHAAFGGGLTCAYSCIHGQRCKRVMWGATPYELCAKK